MKKAIIIAMSASLIMTSCQNQFDESESLAVGGMSTFEAIAEPFGVRVKTTMTEENNIVWAKGDEIAVFKGCTTAERYILSDKSAGISNGSFTEAEDGDDSFVAGTELAANIAFYPYSSDLSAANVTVEGGSAGFKVDGIILPDIQNMEEGSFANGSFAMVAVTENTGARTLRFRNVMGAMRLRLKGLCSVKQITISGKNGERLSGAASVIAGADIYDPELIMSADAGESVTLECGSGVQLSDTKATDFIIALPPVRFEKGFDVKIVDVENNEYQLEAKTLNIVQRSYILNMPEVKLSSTGAWEGDGAEIITFADAVVKARCVELYDINGDGELSYMEAASVTSLNGLFATYEIIRNMNYNPSTGEAQFSDSYWCTDTWQPDTPVQSFDELMYFTGLQEICYAAFNGCTQLKSVKLPSGIKKICSVAFGQCNELTKLDFPEGVKIINSFPRFLVDIVIPEGVEEISVSLFSQREYTLSLPKTVKKANINRYGGCNVSLKGSGIASDGVSFVNEDGVLLYYFDDGRAEYAVPEGVKTMRNIREGSFTTITFPSTLEEPGGNMIPPSVTEIKGKFASQDGRAMISGNRLIGVTAGTDSYQIPSSVTSLADGAFADSKIRAIEIPSTVQEWGQSVFAGCSELTDVILPENLTVIPAGTFQNCVKLKNINLSGVSVLEESAFNGCSELLKEFTVPAGIQKIGNLALYVNKDNPVIVFQSLIPPVLDGIIYWDGATLVEDVQIFGESTTVYVPDAAMAKYNSPAYSWWHKIDKKPVSEMYADQAGN